MWNERLQTSLIDARGGTVLISTLEESPDRGPVYLRIVKRGETLRLGLTVKEARGLLDLLQKHVGRIESSELAMAEASLAETSDLLDGL